MIGRLWLTLLIIDHGCCCAVAALVVEQAPAASADNSVLPVLFPKITAPLVCLAVMPLFTAIDSCFLL